ncbi:MAG: dihydrofolate reductase family protein [Bacteroidota bacterium]
MPRVVLFIATSLDGFVADADGGVDWLFTDADYGYADFFASVGALAMGRTTYDQILGFGPWPYGDVPTTVFTNRPLDVPREALVAAAEGDVATWLDAQETQRIEGDVWLVGGSALVRSFREAARIDRYVLSVHPVLLGDGIPLFDGTLLRESLRLTASTSFPSGLVQLTYDRAPPSHG